MCADVTLANLSKRYASSASSDFAIRKVNLDVRDGELLALVGPSGCGKTTMLRLIAGLERPSSGVIRIGGRIVNDLQPRDRDVAMVFQDHALYPHMSVRQNMAFPLKMRRFRKRGVAAKVQRQEIDERVRRAGASLGLVQLLDRKPGSLSGGERQRAALGRAVVCEPKCFLLDEPLSNLDASLRTRMRAEIKAMQQRLKATMIYVTHDQEEAMMLGDRVAVMSRGAIQQIGTPSEAYRRPVNRFVASFIGTPAMNFIDGRIEQIGDGLVFRDDSGMQLSMPNAETYQKQINFPCEMTLGVRPEHVQLKLHAQSQPPTPPSHPSQEWIVNIAMTQMLGDRTIVHARTRTDRPVVAIVGTSDAFEVGQCAIIAFDPDQLHFFERGEFGRRL